MNAEANRTIDRLISTECWGFLYYSFLSYYLSVSAFKTKSCLSLDSGRLKQRCLDLLSKSPREGTTDGLHADNKLYPTERFANQGHISG